MRDRSIHSYGVQLRNGLQKAFHYKSHQLLFTTGRHIQQSVSKKSNVHILNVAYPTYKVLEKLKTFFFEYFHGKPNHKLTNTYVYVNSGIRSNTETDCHCLRAPVICEFGAVDWRNCIITGARSVIELVTPVSSLSDRIYLGIGG